MIGIGSLVRSRMKLWCSSSLIMRSLTERDCRGVRKRRMRVLVWRGWLRCLNRERAWRLELWSVFEIDGGRNRKSTGWFGSQERGGIMRKEVMHLIRRVIDLFFCSHCI